MKSRRMGWMGNTARIGEMRCLVGEREGKTPLRRFWRRVEDNIKMDIREIG
jgi:hypothetical protein